MVRGERARQQRISKKQRAFVEAFRLTVGNVSKACEKIGITRTTYYRWRMENEKFAEMVSEVDEEILDFTETALKKQIAEGNITAIIFHLKTKGKDRGYTERQEIDTNIRSFTVELTDD